MRARNVLPLLGAVLLGTVAVVGVRSALTPGLSPTAAPLMPQATLVVARTPMAFGTKLTPENLTTIPWPSEHIPEGSFRNTSELLVDGAQRVVLRSFEANEPILDGKISGPDGRGILSVTIAEGMRALSIRVNDVHGVAGFVLPGDRVDIMLTRDINDNARNDVLLQNVRVLGIDQSANDRAEGAKVARAVTVEVTAEQAQKLTLAASIGTLVLALRNQSYVEIEKTRPVTISDLGLTQGNSAAAAPTQKPVVTSSRAPAPQNTTMRVYRGLTSDTVRVTPEPATIARPASIR